MHRENLVRMTHHAFTEEKFGWLVQKRNYGRGDRGADRSDFCDESR